MKKFYVFIFLLVLASTACMRNEYLVESDYSYSGTFKKYKTFDFMTEIGAVKESAELRATVEEAIQRRMELQGYKQEEANPDLLVSFKVFNGNFKFNGYNQPDIESWMSSEREDEQYIPVSYNMHEGTIIVILWDRKKRRVVWQGYATSMFGNPQQNEKYVRWAVRSIFDQYKVFGNEMMTTRRFN
ncbi:MAG: DUF4136 domain-containing protein [Cyclobacteriaceae bacterium]|nr:DUF4136 domain-containing protein [Cyclobacteriaceae bacterium]